MRLALQIGPLHLLLTLRESDGDEKAAAPVEVVFLNPEHDDEDCREFIDSLHRDLGSYNQ